MIELEIKYRLEEPPKNLNLLNYLGNKTQHDVYYDTKDYALLKGGNFLRVRNGIILEFKIDIGDNSHLFCKETSFTIETLPSHIEEINSIFEVLGIPNSPIFTNFNQFVCINNLQIIAPINKKRSNYRFDKNCTVSIDEVDDLGLFLEAEIIIDSDNISLAKADEIKSDLVDRLFNCGVLTDYATTINVGYVELYLFKYNKKAYYLGKFI